MANWKHTAAAVAAVATVVSMTVVQFGGLISAMADEKTGKEAEMLNIQSGDGRGETPEFSDADMAPEFESKTGYIIYSDGQVNIREEASKESNILGMLNFGDSFTVEDVTEDGLWYKILADTVSGYVMCDLVTFDYSEVEALLFNTTMYRTGTVSVSGGKLNVRSTADDNAVVLGQIADGTVVYIDSIAGNGFYKVLFGNDYDIGYVKSDYIISGELVSRTDIDNAKKDRLDSIAKKGYIVTNSSYVNVRTAPSADAPVVTTVKNGISVTVLSTGSKWTKILTSSGSNAYIITSAVLSETAYADYKAKMESAKIRADEAQKTNPASTTPAVNGKGAQIIAEAEKYLGTPYVYGGSSPSGFDCSGFVQYTLKKVGINVNRSSRDQYKNGVAVAKSDLQTGDLVFFSKGGSISHVGIYAGNGKVIHSPSPGKVVSYSTLDHMCSYSTYVGARRVY
ncbi:MAG: NlpC/P60 family protein [Clostridia bacterium]|nr:NlpC/P60 family protein [Clostridia bacterium]